MTLFPSGYSLLPCKLLPRYIEWLTSCSASRMEVLKSELGDDNSDVFACLLGSAVVCVEMSPKVAHPSLVTPRLAAAICWWSHFCRAASWSGHFTRRVQQFWASLCCAPTESSHCEGARAGTAQCDKSPTQSPPTAFQASCAVLAPCKAVVRVLGAVDWHYYIVRHLLLASCGLCSTRAGLFN